uniref:Ricin B lectin domain-containing protein n=1 Tax=Anopheles epiroticus TaxID=199890 RepID=A0A182PBN7_9DIPT
MYYRGAHRVSVALWIVVIFLLYIFYYLCEDGAYFIPCYRSPNTVHKSTPPGDMGIPVRYNGSDHMIIAEMKRSMVQEGLNEYASDLVSVRRRLPDLRNPWCRLVNNHLSAATLPATSIVIVFYNEVWSVLVRTVHSVLNRSPSHLTQLEEYFKPYSVVKIIRAKERLGLIRARMLGAKSAVSDIVTFLDAHVECTEGWLEPLLAVVAHDSTNVAIPTIDRISDRNMSLQTNLSLLLAGAFEWDLNFGWCERKQLYRKYRNLFQPFETPAMAGGLFTINTTFFERMGWYDEGYILYGMENIELSIKTWMCGGRLLTVPCSRVGHIQKHSHSYLFDVNIDLAMHNSARLAEVWMDEYKQVVFDVNGLPRYLEERFGSVEKRKLARERAKCKPFQHYLQRAFPELRSPMIEGQFRGEVRNVGLGANECMTVAKPGSDPYMAPCDGLEKTQYWSHSYYQDINSYKACLDFEGSRLTSAICHRHRGNQSWMYVPETKQIWNLAHKRCLTVTVTANHSLALKRCNASNRYQQWLVNLDPPPGDLGLPVQMNLRDNATIELVGKGLKMFGYNAYASDLMSVRRRLPDIRATWCREQNLARSRLPSTSIVIVFYNEAWSVLLRTVHSILDRTPHHLLHEIVLVDDHSTAAYLKTRLDDYFERFPKIRILRAPKRLGLIAAKMFGAKATTASVITFLDAHVECTKGWLEPLLEVIARNSSTIAIPTIDQIDEYTMQLKADFGPKVFGAYQWDLNFGWWGRAVMKKRYPNPYVPFDTPAMAGGLFSIERTFFERLGWYDEGFEMYGIENIELSMKSWMCGGRMVIVPCSRVAHIKKQSHPYFDSIGMDIVMKNSLRLAEVWMDEYKQVIFDVYGIPRYFPHHFGSVDARKALRSNAKCVSFRDYVLNAFPEMMNPLVPGAFRGEVHNAALPGKYCLTHHWTNHSLSMAICDGKERQQYWTHNFYHELNNYSSCIELIAMKGFRLGVQRCHRNEKTRTQRWQYVVKSGQIKSEIAFNQCLAVRAGGSTIEVERCNSSEQRQKWLVKFIELDVSIFRYN